MSHHTSNEAENFWSCNILEWCSYQPTATSGKYIMSDSQPVSICLEEYGFGQHMFEWENRFIKRLTAHTITKQNFVIFEAIVCMDFQ